MYVISRPPSCAVNGDTPKMAVASLFAFRYGMPRLERSIPLSSLQHG
jgi:hypothetical protein